ncbi:hypothetical protein Tco_0846455, partial [Tanacetum coccineum]
MLTYRGTRQVLESPTEIKRSWYVKEILGRILAPSSVLQQRHPT